MIPSKASHSVTAGTGRVYRPQFAKCCNYTTASEFVFIFGGDIFQSRRLQTIYISTSLIATMDDRAAERISLLPFMISQHSYTALCNRISIGVR